MFRIIQRSLWAVPSVVAGSAIACNSWQVSSKEHKLRVIPLSEVREHNRLDDDGRIWVTYKGDVFDITDFSAGHPGGTARLLMAAGGDLEPFWEVYTQHNRDHIYPFLMRYRIGTLTPEDATKSRVETTFSNPYTNDPEPKPDLLTNTRFPYNAEAPLDRLTEDYITPTKLHFVRNHGLVPDIDPADYTLTIEGMDGKTHEFTLEDLKTKFEKRDVVTVIQCNGNRREDYHYLKGNAAFGPPHWVAGAISNAKWSGPLLRDVLKECGVDVDAMALGKVKFPKEQDVCLQAYDTDETGEQYAASIPLEKVVDPFGDCILAYEMNDEPLPRFHGYPIRCLVPGHAGARNVKFLQKVHLGCYKGGCNWKQYAHHAPDVTLEKLAEFNLNRKELVRDPIVQEMPVQSMICNPSPNSEIAIDKDTSTVPLKGVAWGGGGSAVNRVDVSLDGGKNFTRAELHKPIEQARNKEWGWYHFSADLPLPESHRQKLQKGEKVELELTSKACNTAWNVQPENPQPYINAHGVCINHFYRVPVTARFNDMPASLPKPKEFHNLPSGGAFRRPFRHFDPPSTTKKMD